MLQLFISCPAVLFPKFGQWPIVPPFQSFSSYITRPHPHSSVKIPHSPPRQAYFILLLPGSVLLSPRLHSDTFRRFGTYFEVKAIHGQGSTQTGETKKALSTMNMRPALSHPPPRKRGSACTRCRLQKIRCGGQHPDCSNCLKAGVICIKPPAENESNKE